MKIQDLRRNVGDNGLLIWPLRVWTSHGGDSFAVSQHAVLAGVRRIGDRLTIAVKYDNREHTGSLDACRRGGRSGAPRSPRYRDRDAGRPQSRGNHLGGGSDPVVSRLLHDLYAFLQEHRRCGELASRRQ
jgi:hypothetical protein